MNDEEMKRLSEKFRALEEAGEFYVDNVEIIFPPQVRNMYGLDGIIVPIRDILTHVSAAWNIERPDAGRELMAIRDEFYPMRDEDEEDVEIADEPDTEQWDEFTASLDDLARLVSDKAA